MRSADYTATKGKAAGVLHAATLTLMLFLATGPWLLAPITAAASTWSPEAEIADYVKNNYPWAEFEITDLRMGAPLPAERPVAILVEKTPPGRSAFRFDFAGTKSITASCFVKAYDRVVMSRSGLLKGRILLGSDLYGTLMENGRIPKNAAREEHQVVGKRLLRSVVPNMPITEAMVSEMPLVKRGRKIMLAVETGGFSIKTAGELKQDASVGEHVKATNLATKKTVAGLLLDENTVKVEY